MSESVVRTLSGIVYIALLVSATLFSPDTFQLLFGIFLIVAASEFTKLVKLRKDVPITVALVLLISNTSTIDNPYITYTYLAIAVLVNCKLIYDLFKKGPIIPRSAFMSGLELLGYIILPFLLLIRLGYNGHTFNPSIIIGIFILIWTNDTFAYLAGRKFGKHKLFERISPKKTVEGFIGGLIFAIIGSVIISRFEFFGMSVMLWVATAVILVIAGTLGDLIESRFKRNAGVKDSGNIMPGHGGILDRLDSIIFAIPFLFLFYQIINYVS